MIRGARELRIIGGRLRGRKWRFPDAPGLRPTPDRVRETLFNWLQPRIAGARCLDLFAGSGALGLEALSRGAASCCFVEANAAAARELSATIERFRLAPAEARLQAQPAERWLAGAQGPFDIVFLDPPFAAGLLAPTLQRLDEGDLLAPDAWVYVEHAARDALPALPERWQPHRDGRAGEVGYHLLRVQARAPAEGSASP